MNNTQNTYSTEIRHHNGTDILIRTNGKVSIAYVVYEYVGPTDFRGALICGAQSSFSEIEARVSEYVSTKMSHNRTKNPRAKVI